MSQQPDSNRQAEEHGGGNPVVMDTRLKVAGTANENAIPREYIDQYTHLPDHIKQRCPWETISANLHANGGEKLQLAQAMQGGGELVGIDSEGRAMFKDKGTEPVMYGYNSYKQLLRIYDRKPEEMEKVKTWANYPEIRAKLREEGYEMFPCDSRGASGKVGDYGDLSDDMMQIEMNTKRQFVASKNRRAWRASWLESDKNPKGSAWCIDFSEAHGTVGVFATDSNRRDEEFGVIRLLRV